MTWAKMERMGRLYGRKLHKAYASPQFHKLIKYQRNMRRNPTRAESRFKRALFKHFNLHPQTKRKKCKHLIVTQRIFMLNAQNGYIADFYLPKHQIIFEVDGDSHYGKLPKAYDDVRTSYFASRGIKVFRITNNATRKPTMCENFIAHAIRTREQEPEQPEAQPVQMDRNQELELQLAYIADKGVTLCPTIRTGRKIGH